jgi:hypothetical protein
VEFFVDDASYRTEDTAGGSCELTVSGLKPGDHQIEAQVCGTGCRAKKKISIAADERKIARVEAAAD